MATGHTEYRTANNLLHPPIKSYFTEEILELERHLIFESSPKYAGHSLWVPSLNDFCVLPHHQNGTVLVKNINGTELLSNICRHRQATILQGRGNTRSIQCPMHRWTYDGVGSLLSAPGFSENPHLDLEKFPTKTWNELHFIDPNNSIAKLNKIPREIMSLLNLKNYYFDHLEVYTCNYNWKTFIEFYLEDYHVSSLHPGLGKFISCDDLRWFFGEGWSAQTVGFFKDLKHPGNSEIYREWHKSVLNYYNQKLPSIAAIWILIYPNTMIEWYPLITVISTIYPEGPLQSKNVVEYYHNIDLKHREDGAYLAALATQAYLETAAEDNQLGERMQEGRHALVSRCGSEIGPYQAKLEAGMMDFHHFWHARMNSPTLL